MTKIIQRRKQKNCCKQTHRYIYDSNLLAFLIYTMHTHTHVYIYTCITHKHAHIYMYVNMYMYLCLKWKNLC